MTDNDTTEKPTGFADTPSKQEWLNLLRDLKTDLAAMELRIDQIKSHDLPILEKSSQNMRERIDMIVNRLSKRSKLGLFGRSA